MRKTLLAFSLVLIAIPMSLIAQDFAKGYKAFLDRDYGEMVVHLRPLAEQGDPRAQAVLGASYANGLGVEKDDVVAAQLYQSAAEQGVAMAQFNLGVIYSEGRGVAQSDDQAFFGIISPHDKAIQTLNSIWQ